LDAASEDETGRCRMAGGAWDAAADDEERAG
jgi:hypothetical protein